MQQEMKVFKPSKQETKHPIDTPAVLFHRLGLLHTRDSSITEEIRHGFSVSVIDKLNDELAIPQKILLQYISLSSATLTRRRTEKRLTPQESSRVYRIAAIYRAALELFENDSDSARRWLKEPAKALGGHPPLAHLDTEAGADEVQDLIGKLEYGVIT